MESIEIKAGDSTLTFRVTTEPEYDSGTPWDNSEGHGVVSDWTSRTKRPGEWILAEDRHLRRFYDFAQTMKIAKRDNWGLDKEELEAWAAERGGCWPTKAMIAERAVKKDFDHLKAWCDGEWRYVGVIVTLLDDEGDETEVNQSLWSVDDSDCEYVNQVAQELAEEIAGGYGTSWGFVPKMVPVQFPGGESPELPRPFQDLHDHIHLLQQERDSAGRLCSQFEDRMGTLQVENGKLQDANRELRRENEALERDVKEYRRQLGLSHD